MRVIQYLSRFRAEDGGVQQSVQDLSALLAASGHEVRLLTGGPEGLPQSWRSQKPGQPTIVALSPWRSTSRLSAADRDVVREQIAWAQLLHMHAPWDLRGMAIGVEARRARRPYILAVHGMLDDWTMRHRALKKRIFLAFGGSRYIRRADLLQCSSAVEVEQAGRWARGARFGVAPLPIDEVQLVGLASTPKPARSDDLSGAVAPRRLLFLGRIDPIKGIEDAITVISRLWEVGIGAQLDIAGTGDAGYVESLRALARTKLVAERVHFHGHVRGDAKCALLRDAELLILPSRHENFGLALVEALAWGTPVVTTRAVNIWRELEASGGATIVPALAVDCLHDAVHRLLADCVALREQGVRGQQWVGDTFSPAQVAARYEALYRAIVPSA